MGFFLPYFLQKRVLRYALSRLDVIDVDAFDLDKLDIALGKKSTVELRDLGLKQERLKSILQLPEDISITEARISQLRLTIPADIYASGISVEVEGVRACAVIRLKNEKPTQKDASRHKGEAKQPLGRPALSEGHVSSQSKPYRGSRPYSVSSVHDAGEQFLCLPTTESLAHSFVENENSEDHAQLKDAIAKSQNLDQSQISDYGEDAADEGFGIMVSLPGFITDFLNGIQNRLQIQIKDIRLDIDLELGPLANVLGGNGAHLNNPSFRLSLESIKVKETASLEKDVEIRRSDLPTALLGTREIAFSEILVTILSDSSVLHQASQQSAPASSVGTQGSGHVKTEEPPLDSQDTGRSASPFTGAHPDLLHSTMFESSVSQDPSHIVAQSRLTSDTDTYADADTGEDLAQSRQTFFTTETEHDPSDSRYEDFSQSQSHAQASLGVEESLSKPYRRPIPSSEWMLRDDRETSNLMSRTTVHGHGNQWRLDESNHSSSRSSTTSLASSGMVPSNDAQVSLLDTFENGQRTVSDNSTSDRPLGDPRQLESQSEDLTESRLFTHEEAESMYMSAISSTSSATVAQMQIPGGWDIEGSQDGGQNPVVSVGHKDPYRVDMAESVLGRTARDGANLLGEASRHKAVGTTPSQISQGSIGESLSKESDFQSRLKGEMTTNAIHSQTPDLMTQEIHYSNERQGSPRSTKTLVRISSASVSIPILKTDSDMTSRKTQIPHSSSPSLNRSTFTSVSQQVQRNSSALSRGASSEENQTRRGGHSSGAIDRQSWPTKVSVSQVTLWFDLPLIRLAAVVLPAIAELHASDIKHADPSDDPKFEADQSNTLINLDSLSLKLTDSLKGWTNLSQESSPLAFGVDSLLELRLQKLRLSRKLEDSFSAHEIAVGKVSLSYADNSFLEKPILSFSPNRRMRESYRDILEPVGNDVAIKIQQFRKRPPEITLMTLPIRIDLDLARLDETFGWFGGLSTVMGLGSSMISNATVTGPSVIDQTKGKTRRGVRFEASASDAFSSIDQDSSSAKVTARIGGLALEIQGKSCSLLLEGSALKIVSRLEGVGMQIDKLRFKGPLLNKNAETPSIRIEVEDLRLEYLPEPKEEDLGRLLGLMSPSRDREQLDEDIMVDTLLRQRRRGGLIRINVSQLSGNADRLEDLKHLETLAEDMKKLGKVAKYFPEDDRPGILVMTLVEDLALSVEINQSVGVLQIVSRRIEVGFVTFPFLMLLGIDSLSIKHQEVELFGECLMLEPQATKRKVTGSQRQPMIMIRLIGDEIDPTVKVKLWNARLEYRVSTLIAFLDAANTESGGTPAHEMITSISTSAGGPSQVANSKQGSPGNRSVDGRWPKRIELRVRDTSINLNPEDSNSQLLLVASDAKALFSAIPTSVTEFNGSLEIKKLTLMLVDDISRLAPRETWNTQHVTFEPRERAEHIDCLLQAGYVSVGEISSAGVEVKNIRSEATSDMIIDIEIRDDLFVLETCADSTQTLISVLSGVTPPKPPIKEMKYRTEVVPVQDMLASFTGESFETVEDRDEDVSYGTGPEVVDEFTVEDEVPDEYQLSDSFQSSIATSTVNAENSLLVDHSIPLETSITESVAAPIAKDTGFEEREDTDSSNPSLHFDENYFGKASVVGGRAHRWNSEKNAYDLSNDLKVLESPFRLRIRDVHFIWNLFDGYDWQHTRDAISQAITNVEVKAAERQTKRRSRSRSRGLDEEDDSIIGDCLFNSIYIGIPANRDPRELSHAVNRNLDDHSSEAESLVTTTTTATSPSRQGVPRAKRHRLRLQRSQHHKMAFELKGISADIITFPPGTGETQSSIDVRINDLEIFDHVPTSTWKKFATYLRDAGERESGSNMVHIEILNVKPVPELAASEIILKANILPLRLHVDQDALDFLSRFFEFKGEAATNPSATSDPPFLQRVEISAVPVRLDFKPKRVDYAGLRSGRTTEFMNFFVLDEANMVMRRVIIYGVSGFDKLGKTLNDIWMPDIRRNQLPGILAGLAPVRSLVNVGSGVKDLVVIPMREYRRDGRVLRSIQKGAFAFARTTTTELVKLGAKLAVGTQTILQNAEDILSPMDTPGDTLTLSGDLGEEKVLVSPYADQPVGVMHGLRGAYRHLERDLLLAKDAIVAMPGEVIESGSASGAAKAVLRGAPTIVLKPALGVTKAVGQTLMGATNSLDKEHRRKNEDKYKRR